jgi:hypothetical protein
MRISHIFSNHLETRERTDMTMFRIGLSVALIGTASVAFAAEIPSPANDIAPQGIGFSPSAYAPQNGPTKINDGDRDGNYGGPNSIAHTASGGAGNYMGVHFSSSNPLDQVDIFNRTDCCGARIDDGGLVPFTLDIISGGTSANHYLDGTIVYTNNYTFNPTISLTGGNGDTASGMVIKLPGTFYGDTVEVIQNNADYMNLAEIEVYTSPEPSSLAALAGLGAMGLFVLARRRTA